MAGNNIIVAASIEPKVIRSTYVPTGTFDGTQYTVPSGQSVKIATATVTNITAAPVTISLSLAAVGQSTVDNSHRILSSYVLPANDTLELSFLKGAMLGPGDFIAGAAGTGNAVVLVLTGTVHS